MLNVIREGRAKKAGTIYIGSYARVSTDKEDQKNSFISQRSYFAGIICQEPGLELYNEYFDEGISGTSLKKRDAFNRMLSDASMGRLDVIVTKEVSRFARNTVDVLSISRKLRQQGVQVIFLNDGINTFSNDGELRLSLMASLAQEESRKTSERVKWGQSRRMEQGVVFGRSMLGYDVKDGAITICPEGAKVVKLIFHKYLNEGLGAFRIARDLEEMGIQTYSGNRQWTSKVIYSILRNEKYVGDLEQKKTYTPNYLNHDKKYNHGVEDKVFIQNHHEPIVDRKMWELVQAEIKRRGELIPQERHSKYSNKCWCSGKLRCTECGSYLTHSIRTLQHGTERQSWRCSQAARFGTRKLGADGNLIGCDAQSVNEQVLTYCVLYCIQHVQFHREQLAQEILVEVRAVQQEKSTCNTEHIENEIKKQEEKWVQAIKLRISGEISFEELALFRKASEQETSRLREKLCEDKDSSRREVQQSKQITEYVQKIWSILDNDNVVTGSDEAFLGQILERVLVCRKNEVDVKLKALPFSFRLQYVTSGRGKNYTVKVNHWEQVMDVL